MNLRVQPQYFVFFGIVLVGCQSPSVEDSEETRPNILLIMADDMGYSDLGCYGGEINTPNIDQLAEEGIRFTQFYNGARCCPTRASLLTGLSPHLTGMGGMVSGRPAEEVNSCQGYLNSNCVTLAEALRPAGYRTYMTGKWHVGEFRPVFPTDRGFDRHYRLIGGAMNYWNISKGKRKKIHRTFAEDTTMRYTYEGGLATPMIIRWGERIKKKGSLSPAIGHITDIIATLVDVGKAEYLELVGDNSIHPLEGKSLLPILTEDAKSIRSDKEVLVWEHEGNRALRSGDWKLEKLREDKNWKSFNLKNDRMDTRDVVLEFPQIVDKLTGSYKHGLAEIG